MFGGLNSVKSHIQQAHCELFHKCPSCPMAFKSASSIQNHVTEQHPTLTDAQTMYGLSCKHRFHLPRLSFVIFHRQRCFSSLTGAPLSSHRRSIFKCVMCDTVFTNKNLLHVHFDSHLINQKVHVYKCPECTKLFSQRSSLLDHYKVSACLCGDLKASFMYLCSKFYVFC